jgi:hypothetical protein
MADDLSKEFAIKDVQEAAARGLRAGLSEKELRWLFANALSRAAEPKEEAPIFSFHVHEERGNKTLRVSVPGNPPDFTSRRLGQRN